jgi:multisubunit Na+/H+ antiporter MnhC subunit
MTFSISGVILIAVLAMLAVGIYGLLAVRNLIKVIVALQILGKGAVLALVLAGYVRGQANLGQSMALTVIVADTIVAVIGMALAVQIRRHVGTLDIQALTTLRR